MLRATAWRISRFCYKQAVAGSRRLTPVPGQAGVGGRRDVSGERRQDATTLAADVQRLVAEWGNSGIVAVAAEQVGREPDEPGATSGARASSPDLPSSRPAMRYRRPASPKRVNR